MSVLYFDQNRYTQRYGRLVTLGRKGQKAGRAVSVEPVRLGVKNIPLEKYTVALEFVSSVNRYIGKQLMRVCDAMCLRCTNSDPPEDAM